MSSFQPGVHPQGPYPHGCLLSVDTPPTHTVATCTGGPRGKASGRVGITRVHGVQLRAERRSTLVLLGGTPSRLGVAEDRRKEQVSDSYLDFGTAGGSLSHLLPF